LLSDIFVIFVAYTPTNVCSQFLQRNWLKTKNSLLTDFNLNGQMVLPTTNLQTDIENLPSNIQPQKITLLGLW